MTPSSKHNSLALFAATVLFGAALAAHAQSEEAVIGLQPADPPAVRDVRWRRVGPALTALHEQYVAHKATRSSKAFAASSRSLKIADDMVVIDTAADGDVATLVAALAQLGAVDVVTFKRVVSARLPLAAIPGLADISALRFARPARSMTYVGDTTSQADVAMNSDDARTTFSVDGSSITVGVLSDTFDCAGNYAIDITTLDLPTGIEVLDDSDCPGSDEGRAMLQLIHDVAPGAGLSFHTAFGGQAGFALGIEELAGCPPGSEAGCTAAADPADVIVDDVGYFASPMFQDGIVAQAVDVVAAAGVPYFSSAGNSARASWEGLPFVSSGIAPPGVTAGVGDAHDFDPGAGVDIFQEVTFPAGETTISFQWDQPFFSISGAPGSANDLDICVYDEPPGAGWIFCADDPNFGADPVEVFSFTGPGSFNIVIVKFLPEGGPDPGLMKYVAFDDDFTVVDSYAMTLASTSYGHNNAAGAIGVGAAYYGDTPEFGTDPPLLEAFSSAGGTPILFDTLGAALPIPEVRMRPQIVAPDGTNTTFFGSDDTPPGFCCEGDGFPNFFGTSAAAPHAAAVAALMQEALPGLTPNGVADVLTSSAQDMGTAGFDFDSGYGLIDASTAVGSVHDSASCDGVEFLALSGSPGAGTFSATGSITWSNGDFSDVDGIAPIHIFEDGFESGDTSSWSNTCPP